MVVRAEEVAMGRLFAVKSSTRSALRAAVVLGAWAVLWISVLIALSPMV
jgi:hypothetical protein